MKVLVCDLTRVRSVCLFSFGQLNKRSIITPTQVFTHFCLRPLQHSRHHDARSCYLADRERAAANQLAVTHHSESGTGEELITSLYVAVILISVLKQDVKKHKRTNNV